MWACNEDGCGKIFHTRSAAYRHRQSVHQQKRFECPSCGKLYAQKDSLRRHRLVHHPAPRDVCGDSSTQPPSKRRATEASSSTTSSMPSASSDSEDSTSDDVNTAAASLQLCTISQQNNHRPPRSPASPLKRGYIRAPLSVPFQPENRHYGDKVPSILINSIDNIPVPGRISIHHTDSQGSPRADYFKNSVHAYKTVSEAIYKLDSMFLPRCCQTGPRDEI